MPDAPIINKPNAPIVYHDLMGRDLCGPCAEGVEVDDVADVFVNWRDYDHKCALCEERFAIDEEEEDA